MNTGSEERRFNIGADVVDNRQEKVGTVAFVVVRPPEMRITDIVVSTGAILGRDVVVPVDAVADVEEDTVSLSIGKDELNHYPDYVDVQYKQPPAGWAPPTALGYPTAGLLFPEGMNQEMYYPEPASVTVNTPPGTVGLQEGMDVESSDGHKVGSIAALETDTESKDVTGFVVKHGFLFTHDTFIPAEDVAEIEEGKVRLRLTRDEVQRMETVSES